MNTTDKKSSPDGNAEKAGNVEQIRDILFGAQMKDYEDRFNRFETKLLRETSRLHDKLEAQLVGLEAGLRKSLDALGERQKTEKAERVEALRELAREFKESSRGLEKQSSRIEAQLLEAQAEVERRFLALDQELEHQKSDFGSRLDSGREQMTGNLADLFSEMGQRLRNELNPSKKG